jgi:hypothetical protein
MTTLLSRRTTFASLNVDLYSWVRHGAAVMVMATCLIVFGTRLQEGPVLMHGVSAPTGSEADSYAELRHRVETTLPALRVTSDPAEILGREAAIGTAVKAARPRAAQGEVFTAAVAKNVRAVIGADLTRRSASDRAGLMSDVPAMPPRINERYPTGEALATFPPLLLQALPRLPDDLEYRFMGRDLIIMDGRTNLIVDYLSDVMTIGTAVTP